MITKKDSCQVVCSATDVFLVYRTNSLAIQLTVFLLWPVGEFNGNFLEVNSGKLKSHANRLAAGVQPEIVENVFHHCLVERKEQVDRQLLMVCHRGLTINRFLHRLPLSTDHKWIMKLGRSTLCHIGCCRSRQPHKMHERTTVLSLLKVSKYIEH